jgi:hypothetical protein
VLKVGAYGRVVVYEGSVAKRLSGSEALIKFQVSSLKFKVFGKIEVYVCSGA